jgi:putative membrane protein
MDPTLVDLVLAILHHALVFLLVGLLAMEMALARPGLDASGLSRLGRIDAAYGAVAGLVIVVGIGRVLFGLRGWEYYVANHAFWGKMAAFVAIGLLSIGPTRRIQRWRRAGSVSGSEVVALRPWLKAQAALLLLVLVFAAAMARGYGM